MSTSPHPWPTARDGGGPTNTLVKILVRVGAFALALILFMQVVLPRLSEPGDANIGAGLLAFLALALAGFPWGMYDGRRMGVVPAVICRAVVSGVFPLGWLVAEAVSLVLIPAVIGAAIGSATRRAATSSRLPDRAPRRLRAPAR